MAYTTQYIGSRYVPLFAEPAEWDSTRTYEPLTIVMHDGNSYTSRQYVPVGIEITNEKFWAITGNYNAQVESYRRETARALQAAQDAQNDIDTLLPKADFSTENTVKDYIDSAVQNVQNDIDTLLPKSAFSSENTVKKYVDARVLSFKTVSDMANSDALYDGAVCHTEGFHSSGDDGGAWYSIGTSGVANGMDVIKCGDLYATLTTDGNLTPEKLGARNDASEDATNVFNRLFDIAASSLIPVLLTGKYLLEGKVTVDSGNCLVVYGNVPNVNTTVTTSIGQSSINLTANASIEILGTGLVSFNNMAFSGDGNAITLKSFRNAINNCSFEGFNKAITTEEAANWNGENKIFNCTFHNVRTCLEYNSGSDSDINGCLVDDTCDYFIIGNVSGFKIENNHDYSKYGSTVDGYNTVIMGNYFDHFGKLRITGNGSATIVGNIFLGTSSDSDLWCVKFTSNTVNQGCIVGNSVINASNNNVSISDLGFIDLRDVSYFTNVVVDGNNIRACSSLYLINSSQSITNVLSYSAAMQPTKREYILLASSLQVTKNDIFSIPGGVSVGYFAATGHGNIADLVRFPSITTNKFISFVRMSHDNTITDRIVYNQTISDTSYASLQSIEIFTIAMPTGQIVSNFTQV